MYEEGGTSVMDYRAVIIDHIVSKCRECNEFPPTSKNKKRNMETTTPVI